MQTSDADNVGRKGNERATKSESEVGEKNAEKQMQKKGKDSWGDGAGKIMPTARYRYDRGKVRRQYRTGVSRLVGQLSID